jgi:hypothetical protein
MLRTNHCGGGRCSTTKSAPVLGFSKGDVDDDDADLFSASSSSSGEDVEKVVDVAHYSKADLDDDDADLFSASASSCGEDVGKVVDVVNESKADADDDDADLFSVSSSSSDEDVEKVDDVVGDVLIPRKKGYNYCEGTDAAFPPDSFAAKVLLEMTCPYYIVAGSSASSKRIHDGPALNNDIIRNEEGQQILSFVIDREPSLVQLTCDAAPAMTVIPTTTSAKRRLERCGDGDSSDSSSEYDDDYDDDGNVCLEKRG